MLKNFEEELVELQKKGLKRNLVVGNDFHGINLSSNDYLGLSIDPRVQTAAQNAIQEFGTGGTSSRLLAGTSQIHRTLEKKLAEFFSKEAALVFGSGYHVNTGVIPALAGAGDIIFVDRLCHASILDGVKLSDARFVTYKHNNLEDLENLLKTRRASHRRAIVITEGIFSMDGDLPAIKQLVQLAHEHEAIVYLDEAHSVGMLGPDGKGLASAAGVLDQIDIFIGTLSKSLASQGGFVCAKQPIIDLLISKCRSFIFTTALAPAAVGAALAALELLPHLEERRQMILNTAVSLRKELFTLRYDTGLSQSQIIPIFTGDVETTMNLSSHLFNQGFFVPSIRPPTVPVGEGRVRLSLTFEAVKKAWPKVVEAFASHPKIFQRNKEKIVQ